MLDKSRDNVGCHFDVILSAEIAGRQCHTFVLCQLSVLRVGVLGNRSAAVQITVSCKLG